MVLAGPAAAQAPAIPVGYERGGILFDGSQPLSIAYLYGYEPRTWARYEGLQVLMSDATGANYRRFVTEYAGQVYVYPETATGTFVLGVHDGTLRGSGRALEAEPLRALIEGPLYAPYPLADIQASLESLVGRRFRLRNEGVGALFVVAQARRMSADDVADYLFRPEDLGLFMTPMAAPEDSFLMLICSGRQPGEPATTFAGRYVLVLQAEPYPPTPAPGHAEQRR